MRNIFVMSLIAMLASLGGCAHTISVVPPDVVRTSDMPDRIKKKVGVFIPAESLKLEVATPGGGGDSVKYVPYRDIEIAYHKMLANVFDDVVQVTKTNDSGEFRQRALEYIVSPVIITNSGSTNFTVWEPTNFSADLTSEIRDINGVVVYSPRVVGTANTTAELGIGVNRGLAGQLAIKDALQKMQIMLFDTLNTKKMEIPRQVLAQPLGISLEGLSIDQRLSSLKSLLERKLINLEDYEKKKDEILKGL